jgi:hypothetical protein
VKVVGLPINGFLDAVSHLLDAPFRAMSEPNLVVMVGIGVIDGMNSKGGLPRIHRKSGGYAEALSPLRHASDTGISLNQNLREGLTKRHKITHNCPSSVK